MTSKPGETRVRLTVTNYAYFGDVRMPFCVVPEGLEFVVKEAWLRPKYGRKVVLTWDEIARLRELRK